MWISRRFWHSFKYPYKISESCTQSHYQQVLVWSVTGCWGSRRCDRAHGEVPLAWSSKFWSLDSHIGTDLPPLHSRNGNSSTNMEGQT